LKSSARAAVGWVGIKKAEPGYQGAAAAWHR
jgi:hypothetical protein